MVHHTAVDGILSVERAQKDNRFGGPLCNFLVRPNGQVDCVAGGYAYDSGMGSAQVLADVERDVAPSGSAKSRGLVNDVNGNPYFYDIEVDYVGDGSEIPQAQWESLVKLVTGICKINSWPKQRVVGHFEWTSRKVDPNWPYPEMGDIRQLVGAYLKGKEYYNPDLPRRFARVFEFDREPERAGTREQQDVVRNYIEDMAGLYPRFDAVLHAVDVVRNLKGRHYVPIAFVELEGGVLGFATPSSILLKEDLMPGYITSWLLPHELGHTVGWNVLSPKDGSEMWAEEFRRWLTAGTPDGPTWDKLRPFVRELTGVEYE